MADTGRTRTALSRPKTKPCTHWFTWRYLRCKLEEIPDNPTPGFTLLQLHLIAPRDTPCPITSSGFLAHFTDSRELAAAGGAVAFMTTWMDRDARSKSYQQAEFLWRQGDMLANLALTDGDRDA